jgi:hypothetical protein
MAEVSSALVYAHGRNIVHRDVKPGNIFVEGESGRVLLADFGVARRIGFEGTVTASGVAIGTPAYMSPESLDGGPVDGRSDIFSLGLVAWELLVGERPWQSETLYSLIYSQKCEETPSLVDRRPDVPDRLRKAVERCLKKDPDERWASADVLLAFLCDTGEDEPRLVRRRTSAAGPAGERPAPSFRPRAPRTLSAGRLEVRWNGDLPVVIPPRLKASGRRLWAPAGVLAAALVLAVGLRFAQVSARPAPTTVAESYGDVPSLPAVAATASEPPARVTPTRAVTQATAVMPVVEKRATTRLDRVYASLVVAFRARGGESAVRELQRAEAGWEASRRRDCARQNSNESQARCATRLATLRAEELSELLERTRAR